MVGEVRRRHARYYLDWLTRSTDVAAVRWSTPPTFAQPSSGRSRTKVMPRSDWGWQLCMRAFPGLGMLTESRRWSNAAWKVSRPNRRLTPGDGASSRHWARHDDHGRQYRRRARGAGTCASNRGRTGRSSAAVSPTEQHAFLPPSHRRSRRIVSDCGTRRENCSPARRNRADRRGTAMLGVAHHLKGNLAAALEF